jgi:DNA-binding IscR family transcriptional regulator
LRAADPPGLSLAAPPETISAVKVFKIAGGDFESPDAERDVVFELLRQRDSALQRGLEGITLRSLVDEEDSWHDDRKSHGIPDAASWTC